MKIYEKPKCNCGEPAICLNQGIWLCGDCLMKLQDKLKELKQGILKEIQG